MSDSRRSRSRDRPEVPALLVSAEVAAGLCGVSVRTWCRLDASGRVPRPVLLGRKMKRWQREDLVRWIEAGCPPRREWEARTQRESA